ncbi:hypothetical protein, partial [Brasilonema bromeliae]
MSDDIRDLITILCDDPAELRAVFGPLAELPAWWGVRDSIWGWRSYPATRDLAEQDRAYFDRVPLSGAVTVHA